MCPRPEQHHTAATGLPPSHPASFRPSPPTCLSACLPPPTHPLCSKLDPAVLGRTVLAWGNSLMDYMNNTAMAGRSRCGSSMAMTACFAGPLFNMLVGLGLGFWALLEEQGVAATAVEMDPVVLTGCVFLLALGAGLGGGEPGAPAVAARLVRLGHGGLVRAVHAHRPPRRHSHLMAPAELAAPCCACCPCNPLLPPQFASFLCVLISSFPCILVSCV